MARKGGRTATGIVLYTLAAGQFVMALDTTVMNTALATVADDVGTTVTGIQTAITRGIPTVQPGEESAASSAAT
jgi:hypothetical protein